MTIATLFLTALAIGLTAAVILLALAVFSLRARLLLVENMAHTHPTAVETPEGTLLQWSGNALTEAEVETLRLAWLARRTNPTDHRVGSETLTDVSSPLPARRHAGFAGGGAAARGSAAAPTPSVMFTGPRAPRGVHRA